MDTAIGVLLLVAAIIGLALLLGSFGILMYVFWQRGLPQGAPKAARTGEDEAGPQ